MTGGPPPPPAEDPAPGPPAQVPWTPELPGTPIPQAATTLPPVPEGYGVAPPPVSRGGGWLRRRHLLIVLAVIVALVVAAVVGAAVTSHNSRLPLVSSQSTDGTFHSGDCVSLSSTRVTKSECGGAHDAQVIQVIHGQQTCPSGTQEFDVNDGSGNLCLDTGNNAKG